MSKLVRYLVIIKKLVIMFVINSGYIYFSHYCDDGRARVSTGIKVPPGRKGIIQEELKKSERLQLARVEDAFTAYVESNRRMQLDILREEVENTVRKALGKDKANKGGFIEAYDKMLADMRSGALLQPRSKARYSDASITNYASTLRYLQRYSEATGAPLTFNISEDWLQRLIVWLTQKEYSKNTIAAISSNLKGFLTLTYGKKHKSLIHKSGVLNLSKEVADTEALTTNEINKLYALDLRPAQERARDVFVFACWVGLRSKDLKRINDYKLRGDFFDLLTHKTGERVLIPVHPIARAIYEKYAGELPVFNNNNNINIHIQNICRAAGFKEERFITITRGGRRIAEHYERWELISIHTARRSFATNAVKAGVEPYKVMPITGHKTEKSFWNYVKIKKQQNAEALAEHPFFKGTTAG